jgi:hypothetical protein
MRKNFSRNSKPGRHQHLRTQHVARSFSQVQGHLADSITNTTPSHGYNACSMLCSIDSSNSASFFVARRQQNKPRHSSLQLKRKTAAARDRPVQQQRWQRA